MRPSVVFVALCWMLSRCVVTLVRLSMYCGQNCQRGTGRNIDLQQYLNESTYTSTFRLDLPNASNIAHNIDHHKCEKFSLTETIPVPSDDSLLQCGMPEKRQTKSQRHTHSQNNQTKDNVHQLGECICHFQMHTLKME